MQGLTYNQWSMIINTDNNTVEVTNDETNPDYTRVYDIDGTIKMIEQTNEYVMIFLEDTYHFQFKFEDGNMLVGDLFDENGDHVDDVACFVFGEDDEDIDDGFELNEL